MTANSSVVKITTKTALKGNYLKCIFVTVIVMISYLIISTLTSIISVFAGNIFAFCLNLIFHILLIFPLLIGMLRYFWRLLFSADDSPITVFYYFSSKVIYFKTLRLLFYVIIKCLPVGILLFLPTFFVWLFSKSFIFELVDISIPLWSTNLTYITVFLRTLACVFLVFYMLKYYIAPVLFVADENIDVAEANYMSTVISKKTTFDFISLTASMLGWIALSILVIPLIFTIPYLLTSYAVHVRFAVAEYNKHINLTNSTDF